MSIAQTIADEIGRRIIRGDLEPGQQALVENDLVTEFGASRNIVREAVKTLAAKNLIRSQRRNGTFVELPEKWNLLDPQVLTWMLSEDNTRDALLTSLSEMRRIFEPEAAALAAERASPRQVLEILECYDSMEKYANDPKRAIEFDVRFHGAVLEACGNPLLRSFNESISMLLRANFNLSIQVDNAFIRNLEEHRIIAEAIRGGDPDRARAASIELLSKNENDIKKMHAMELER
ncbi:FadR/GntR family transcriptional regulator [Falsihalocynthiibacter sp. SS001]|uniref:FadR/GntR family transcriptional regulator n=1 Tax=Falsihalocynthiibacter sp. SS001 TaxID=3349698 RepID=UPI0036D2175B